MVQTLPEVTQLDVLFVIDDSPGMVPAQKILAQAVPAYLRRFTNPDCVSVTTRLPNGKSSVVDRLHPEGVCEDPGFVPERRAIRDIHVGILTSSLGDPATLADCDLRGTNTRGRLLSPTTAPTRTRGIGMEPGGFLAFRAPDVPWDASGPRLEHLYTTPEAFGTAVAALVERVGDRGCARPSSLGALRRFLMDLSPEAGTSLVEPAPLSAVTTGVDTSIVEQRYDFLRSDSSVAILQLTNHNDASVRRDDPHAWAYVTAQAGLRLPGATAERTDLRYGPTGTFTLPRGTQECAEAGATQEGNPACKPCWQTLSSAGCEAALSEREDPFRLRAFRPLERFGFDWRTPADVLTIAQELTGPSDVLGPPPPLYDRFPANPFSDLRPDRQLTVGIDRPPGHITYGVITGVPGDLVTAADGSTGAPISASQTEILLGSNRNSPHSSSQDPRMIESPMPRNETGGLSPLDWESQGGALMYACTFPLPPALQSAPTPSDVDDPAYVCSKYWDSPVCDQKLKGNDATDRTLRRAVRGYATPGTRLLEQARAAGKNAGVASICPHSLEDPSSPDYGYRPALEGFAKTALKSMDVCLDVPLNLNEYAVIVPRGSVRCRDRGLVEARPELAPPAWNWNLDGYCEVPRLAVAPGESCEEAATAGFCIVSKDERTLCQNRALFSKATFRLGDSKTNAIVLFHRDDPR